MHNKFLKEIISKKVKLVINEMLQGKLNRTNDINIGNLLSIKDEETFRKWAPQIWDMLVLSYKDIGGLKSYRDYNDFLKKRHIVEVITNNSVLMACSTYRRVEGSLKMVAIGCDQTENGKLALQQIIQNNIQQSELHYWAEVSGAIEHYFKKHNGYPMPNILASEILKIDASKIILSQTDKVHYQRPIGENGEQFTKMIFGAKSDEILQKAIAEVENYGKFMEEVNSLQENASRYNIKQAIYIIENIYRAHEEDGFNELIPSWERGLKESLRTLKMVENPDETILDYIGYAMYLLSDMQPLTLNKLVL